MALINSARKTYKKQSKT